ncbi:MAG: MFS transporter [Mariprofundaceae bacterium]|nr:MFS transporter [Mariprofundaceae bacterium]
MMNALEKRGTFSLAGIYAFRMLGLFMILPVFAIYAQDLKHVTPALMGLALGAYGLTMAVLQIPFGILSDRLGRKPVIAFGLVLFAIGSVVAAMSDDIWGVIIGRALQGSGAIAAVVMALLTDFTREEERTKSMAILGVSIGASFVLALMIGPVFEAWIGVSGLFWLTAALAVVGLVILFSLVPNPQGHMRPQKSPSILKDLYRIAANPELLRLDIGIMVQHAMMMAMFTALPFILLDVLHLSKSEQAWFYVIVLMSSVLFMGPMVMAAERKGKMKIIFLGSIALLITGELVLGFFQSSMYIVGFGLLLFFIGFNVLEACLPSLISRIAPSESKGAAMGVYSSSQFFGAFLGGALGGLCYGAWGAQALFLICAVVALAWLVMASNMSPPKRHFNKK